MNRHQLRPTGGPQLQREQRQRSDVVHTAREHERRFLRERLNVTGPLLASDKKGNGGGDRVDTMA